MTLKKTVLFAVLMLFYITINAQNEISFTIGYGSYLMNDLKSLQDGSARNGGINLIKTTSFPPYYNYMFKYGYKINDKNSIGIVLGLMSTGARSSLADYSGYAVADINCVGYRFGMYFKRKILRTNIVNKPLNLSYSIDLSTIYTNGNFADSLRIYDTTINEGSVINLNSIGVYTEPLLVVDYELASFLNIELMVGYALNFNVPFYYQKISNKLEYNGKEVNPDWTGYRIGIGLVYRWN